MVNGLLLELNKGLNVIPVKTSRGAETNTDNVTVTFQPPLALVVLSAIPQSGALIGEMSVNVTGTVNDPAAEVTVPHGNNSAIATVAANGSFSAQLNMTDFPVGASGFAVEAVAKRGDEIAAFWIDVPLAMPRLGGAAPRPLATLSTHGPLTISPGGSASFEYVMTVQPALVQNVFPSSTCNVSIVPNVPGITATISPAYFTIYPNTIYHVGVALTASSSLSPGTYDLNIQGLGLRMPVSVIIQPLPKN